MLPRTVLKDAEPDSQLSRDHQQRKAFDCALMFSRRIRRRKCSRMHLEVRLNRRCEGACVLILHDERSDKRWSGNSEMAGTSCLQFVGVRCGLASCSVDDDAAFNRNIDQAKELTGVHLFAIGLQPAQD